MNWCVTGGWEEPFAMSPSSSHIYRVIHSQDRRPLSVPNQAWIWWMGSVDRWYINFEIRMILMIVDMSATPLRSEVMARSFRVIGTGCYNKVLRCVTRSPAVTNYLNIPPEGSTLQVCTSSILQHWYSNYYYTFHKFHIRKSKVTTIIEATHAYFHWREVNTSSFWITTSILFRSRVREEILYISSGSRGSHRSLYSSTCKPFTCVSQIPNPPLSGCFGTSSSQTRQRM